MFERLVEVGANLGEPVETFEELTSNYAIINKKFIFLLDKSNVTMVEYHELPEDVKKIFIEEYVETLKIQD
jgi:hypothetical protein